MSYKTIVVHVDQSRHASRRIEVAATLAREHGAHLIGAAMAGSPRLTLKDDAWPMPHTLAASCFEPLIDAARGALDRFAEIASTFQISYEKKLATDQDADALALLARFCDLLVISQDDPDEALPGQVGRLAEYVALNATAPVLIVPLHWPRPQLASRVLVAWNGTVQAARAVQASMPLLIRASAVQLVSFRGPAEEYGEVMLVSEQAQLTDYLARHGVRARQCVREHDADAGYAIVDLAQQSDSDLVVMGCYGHSRFREMLLGGASRSLLRGAPVPLLMAR